MPFVALLRDDDYLLAAAAAMTYSDFNNNFNFCVYFFFVNNMNICTNREEE